MKGYELLDSGNKKKLERFGDRILIRPSSFTLWPQQDPSKWEKAAASFSRKEGRWSFYEDLSLLWHMEAHGVKLELFFSDFGHVGFFPEHLDLIERLPLELAKKSVLHLFAYSGALSIFCAQKEAKVCHVDSSKKTLQQARENCSLNNIDTVRFIQEDAIKFCEKEIRRGVQYDGIILDPPTFGRGNKNEMFKLEDQLLYLLELCNKLLNPKKGFILFTCHSLGMTSDHLHHVVDSTFSKGTIDVGDLSLKPKKGYTIPSGVYAYYTRSHS